MSVGKVLLTHLFTPRCANWQRNIPIFAMPQCWNAFPGKTQMILLRRCFPERWKMSRPALPSTAETTGCFSRRILLWCMSRILGAAPQSSPGKQKNKEKLSLTLRIENAIPTRSEKTSLPKITSGGCLIESCLIPPFPVSSPGSLCADSARRPRSSARAWYRAGGCRSWTWSLPCCARATC